MFDREAYFQRKYRQVAIPVVIVFCVSMIFVIFSLFLYLFDNRLYLDSDIFKFSFIVAICCVPFYGFIRLIRRIVTSWIDK
jgi:hypothetical protein